MTTHLDQNYWDHRYKNGQTGWDMKQASPPFVSFIDTLKNKDLHILIPGCGNAYEAECLIANGFLNLTLIDISPKVCEIISEKFRAIPTVRVLCADFFVHQGQYDYILEQTFFCALKPNLRKQYAKKMHELLAPNGHLVGLLFDKIFEKEGPPFGGHTAEYQQLFESIFSQVKITSCSNSHPARQNSEVWIQCTR